MAKKKNNLTFDTLMSFVSADTQTTISDGNIQQINLVLLRPDPNQPRRLLPDDLARKLDVGTSLTDVVLAWCAEGEQQFASPALVHNVHELKRLADSISQHGLINPVTVRLSDDSTAHQYTIITGERRYWAHVLLLAQGRSIQEGDTLRDPGMIPAIIAPEGVHVRAHQLVENLLREDMNAIEKARGILALRRELSADSENLAPWKHVDEALGVTRQHRNRMV
ncbi:MAG: ParB/RepB/Spo0J family partition protein, partial [Candidatus Promineifilaceae bacterium]